MLCLLLPVRINCPLQSNSTEGTKSFLIFRLEMGTNSQFSSSCQFAYEQNRCVVLHSPASSSGCRLRGCLPRHTYVINLAGLGFYPKRPRPINLTMCNLIPLLFDRIVTEGVMMITTTVLGSSLTIAVSPLIRLFAPFLLFVCHLTIGDGALELLHSVATSGCRELNIASDVLLHE